MTRAPRNNAKPIKHRRQVSVRAVRRLQPDAERLSRALLNFALQQAAAEAAAEAEARKGTQDA